MKKRSQRLCLLFIYLNATIIHAQNVGIGTTNPTAKFHTVGSVRFDTLNGIGVRPVLVDSAGNLFASVPVLPPSTVTNSTGIAIPDFSCAGAASNIIISQLPVTVPSAKIKVTINITHSKPKDLTIYLTAPNGSIINLFATTNNSGSNLTNTNFSDVGDPLSSATPPYNGEFMPNGDLSPNICMTPNVATFGAMGGGSINPNGTWTLKVIDNTSTNTGTLTNWTLTVDPGIGLSGIWNLNGNAGTNQNNFIGTTDASPLRFKVKNRNSGIIDSSQRNTSFGFRAMDSVTTATDNTIVGYNAFKRYRQGSGNSGFGSSVLTNQVSGNSNTAIGSGAIGFGTLTGSNNTAVGSVSLLNIRDGNNNTAIGNNSMAGSQHGSSNTAVGYNSLYGGAGYSNVAIGINALLSFSDRNNLVAIGDSALFNNGTGSSNPQDGCCNIAVGSKTLYTNTIGYSNTTIGFMGLYSNTSGSLNTTSGYRGLFSNTTGSGNTTSGYTSLTQNSTGSFNTAIGFASLYSNTTGYSNVAAGAGSLYNNTDRNNLVAIGDSSLYNNGFGATNGSEAVSNTAIGSKVLFQNTKGSGNTGIGYNSLLTNSTGNFNTATGQFSLYLNTLGGANTANGNGALYRNTTGSVNTGIGNNALGFNTTGAYNTSIGVNSLYTNGDGTFNTALGAYADVSSTSLFNATAIGYGAIANSSNSIQLGDNYVLNVNTAGSINTSKNITVQNGKGIIRSSDGTQQKKVVTIITVSGSITSSNTITIPFSFSESFSSAPDVYVGNVSNPGAGGFAEVVLTISGVSATGATLFVFNPRSFTTSPNYSIKIIAIGPQ